MKPNKGFTAIASDLLDRQNGVLTRDPNALVIYVLLMAWRQYSEPTEKPKLYINRNLPWGKDYVHFTYEELGKILKISRENARQAISRLVAYGCIRHITSDRKNGTIIQVLGVYEKQDTVNQQDTDNTQEGHAQDSNIYNKSTIQQENIATRNTITRDAPPDGEAVCVLGPSDASLSVSITRTESAPVQTQAQEPPKSKKRKPRNRAETALESIQTPYPMEILEAASQLLKLTLHWYPRREGKKGYSVPEYAYHIDKAIKSIGQPASFATELSKFIYGNHFWSSERGHGYFAFDLLKKSGGTRIETLEAQMRAQHGRTLMEYSKPQLPRESNFLFDTEVKDSQPEETVDLIPLPSTPF